MTDLRAEILAALDVRPQGVMTYVVTNILERERGMQITTARIRRELFKLEAEGQVERVPCSYVRQICWRRVTSK